MRCGAVQGFSNGLNDIAVPSLILAGGDDLFFNHKQRFIVHSLSLSLSHLLDMIELLLKGT